MSTIVAVNAILNEFSTNLDRSRIFFDDKLNDSLKALIMLSGAATIDRDGDIEIDKLFAGSTTKEYLYIRWDNTNGKYDYMSLVRGINDPEERRQVVNKQEYNDFPWFRNRLANYLELINVRRC